MLIKVCGMGDAERMFQLAALNIQMLGFIFYPPSPRYVPGKIEAEQINRLPASIKKVGVFVNETPSVLRETALQYHLDTIQLHGNESPELCRMLREAGFSIIKAFNLNKNNNYKAYAPFCDWFLFDTPSEKHGGTGEKFDWSMLKNYNEDLPFLLSGGIGPNDAAELKEIRHPMMAGIDINSKFELSPGIKNIDAIRSLIQQL